MKNSHSPDSWQHTLEQRVIVLEKQFQDFRRAAKAEEPLLSAGPELSRKERDVGDCICPPAIRHNGSIRSIENVLSGLQINLYSI
ncbi:hypothetical protein B5X24_HaOG205731 [Helicoverpa armigera]|uniref:Uncharacterized protein n=1 Tax=Helicoverpa armigera TaxID=29058 RepID=A0A2W1BKY5_HELAM|nr:hypothetical protein B5X24_HaOG205731 [Helicoverpa armigera]